MNLRPAPKEMEELLYPIGASGTNPNDPNVRDSPTIRLGFEKTNRATLYPSMSDFEKYGDFLKGLTSSGRRYNINHIRASEEMSEEELKLLQDKFLQTSTKRGVSVNVTQNGRYGQKPLQLTTLLLR